MTALMFFIVSTFAINFGVFIALKLINNYIYKLRFIITILIIFFL